MLFIAKIVFCPLWILTCWSSPPPSLVSLLVGGQLILWDICYPWSNCFFLTVLCFLALTIFFLYLFACSRNFLWKAPYRINIVLTGSKVVQDTFYSRCIYIYLAPLLNLVYMIIQSTHDSGLSVGFCSRRTCLIIKEQKPIPTNLLAQEKKFW